MSGRRALSLAVRVAATPQARPQAKGVPLREWACAGTDVENVFGLYSYSLRTGFVKLEGGAASSSEPQHVGSGHLSLGTSKLGFEARRHAASVTTPVPPACGDVEDVFGLFTYSLRTGFQRKIHA